MSLIGSDLSISQLIETLCWKVAESNQRGPDRVQFTLTKLDHLRATLSETSTAFAVLRNSFCPVNQLPPELLAAIFGMGQIWVSDFHPRPSDLDSKPHASTRDKKNLDIPKSLSWMKATFVCHYWRQTALSFPSLWSNIIAYNTSPDLAKLFIERSKAAKLNVYYKWPECKSDLFEILASNCHRLLEFHATAVPPDEASALQSLMQSAPFLQALSIRIEGDIDRIEILLPPIFADHTPRLRKITLRYFSSWRGNNFKNLTHFSLHSLPDDGQYTCLEFLEFLEASPGLQELVLANAGPPDAVSGQEREPVALDQLRSLELGSWGDPQMVADFLDRLIIPRNTDLTIWGCNQNMEPVDTLLSILFPTHSCHRRNISGLTNIHIAIVQSSFGHVFVRGSTLTVFGPFLLNQIFTVPTWLPDRVEEIHLSCDPNPDLLDYVAFFHNMPLPSTLTFCGAYLPDVVDAMQILHGHVEDDESQLIIPEPFWLQFPDAHLPGATTYHEDVIAQLQRYIHRVELRAGKMMLDGLWPTVAFSWHADI